jgi:hypothetical protein
VEISCITTLQIVKWASLSGLLMSGQLARPPSRGTETGRPSPATQSAFTSRNVCRSLKAYLTLPGDLRLVAKGLSLWRPQVYRSLPQLC